MIKRYAYFAIVGALILCVAGVAAAQNGSARRFRTGERLSYNLSFGKFRDGGYAELYVASRGKLAGRDAIEIRAKFKTIDVVAASFMLIDETRTVFLDPTTGSPLFARRTVLDGPTPVETSENYLEAPSSNLDLVGLIYKLRASSGTGSYTFSHGDQVYTVTFQASGGGRVRTEAGEFEVTVVTVQSEFLLTQGIRNLKVYITKDDARVPVVLRFTTGKGEFRATLAAVHIIQPPAVAQPGPETAPTPVVMQTPRPTPSPTPYIDNVPLLGELGFALGEKLNYRVTAGNQQLATILLEAVERKEFNRMDSMLLTATVTGVFSPNQFFKPGDTVRVRVDPETLAPMTTEGVLGASLASFAQTATFDKTGKIGIGDQKLDAPVGTHTFLSLMYAMRSFNLQPSKVTSSPVNDTRVAVLWNGKPTVFTLRPSSPADIEINGSTVSAQLITVTTGDTALDAMGVKVWLAANNRVPLRYSIGTYQADIIRDLSK